MIRLNAPDSGVTDIRGCEDSGQDGLNTERMPENLEIVLPKRQLNGRTLSYRT